MSQCPTHLAFPPRVPSGLPAGPHRVPRRSVDFAESGSPRKSLPRRRERRPGRDAGKGACWRGSGAGRGPDPHFAQRNPRLIHTRTQGPADHSPRAPQQTELSGSLTANSSMYTQHSLTNTQSPKLHLQNVDIHMMVCTYNNWHTRDCTLLIDFAQRHMNLLAHTQQPRDISTANSSYRSDPWEETPTVGRGPACSHQQRQQ